MRIFDERYSMRRKNPFQMTKICYRFIKTNFIKIDFNKPVLAAKKAAVMKEAETGTWWKTEIVEDDSGQKRISSADVKTFSLDDLYKK